MLIPTFRHGHVKIHALTPQEAIEDVMVSKKHKTNRPPKNANTKQWVFGCQISHTFYGREASWFGGPPELRAFHQHGSLESSTAAAHAAGRLGDPGGCFVVLFF